jgi:hypothetical protein
VKQKKKDLQLNFDCSVFVKPLPAVEKQIISGSIAPLSLVYKNNFRCMGKISNWDMFKRIPKKKTIPMTTETKLSSSSSDNIGYANWKRNKLSQ